MVDITENIEEHLLTIGNKFNLIVKDEFEAKNDTKYLITTLFTVYKISDYDVKLSLNAEVITMSGKRDNIYKLLKQCKLDNNNLYDLVNIAISIDGEENMNILNILTVEVQYGLEDELITLKIQPIVNS